MALMKTNEDNYLYCYRSNFRKNFMPKHFTFDRYIGCEKYPSLKKKMTISELWCYFLKNVIQICNNPHCINEIGRDDKFLYIKFTNVNRRERYMLHKYKIRINAWLLKQLESLSMQIPQPNTKWRISFEYDTAKSIESGLSDTDSDYVGWSSDDSDCSCCSGEGQRLISDVFL